ncbi:hypothetical protein ETH_00006830 [Eimeria tenella]|uniref:Uncharacterized protein n=1 Tax=Eimeria tenella TaxID=5802 RepID=U6KXA4_EIMTE|nr:hypothetical protein ETH_00006830 [Eimeria tenella]CDJ42596.1 hypothetical protein ETH_00006830 [Eimeria tenella]|eukprot:XP_013233346.1 hypothetical protein ETH_00006830 [Eimeria tenella]
MEVDARKLKRSGSNIVAVIEDAMQLCAEANALHGRLPQWRKCLYLLERKLAMIRGGLGTLGDAVGPIPAKVEIPHWSNAIEAAISLLRLHGKAAHIAGSNTLQNDHLAGPRAETQCSELLRAWAILEPQLPQIVRDELIIKGSAQAVNAQLQQLQKSIEAPRNVGENEHFAGYLVAKAALTYKFWALARIMTKVLGRWQAGTANAAVLQRMLDIETELRLHEFLTELYSQESTSLSRPASLSLLTASIHEPCPIIELRVQAIRRLDECLTSVAHGSETGDLVETCVATMWNIARPCLGPEFRRLVYRNMQKACNALDRYQSSQISLRVHLSHQLAQCEIEEELFKAAQTTIDKALEIEYSYCSMPSYKTEPASAVQPATSAMENPVMTSTCTQETAANQADLAYSQPLTWSLRRLGEVVSLLSLTAGNCSPAEQLQHIAFRTRLAQPISTLIDLAEGLRKKALRLLADDEAKNSSRQSRVDRHGTSRRGIGSPQAVASTARRQALSLSGERTVKCIIASFGHLVTRARDAGDVNATARAAIAILSMVHGTEKCLSSPVQNLESFDAVSPVDLRVRLRPPLETELAVNVIEAAYELVCFLTRRKLELY